MSQNRSTEDDVLSFDPSKNQQELLKAWHIFMESGIINNEIVPPHIAESWQRSKKYKVDPYDFSPDSYIESEKYKQRIEKSKGLIDLARPIMENVYKSLEQTKYLVVLYDSDGYHLLRIGQRADFERSSMFKIREGLCFDEKHVGTSGFSLVKRLLKPVQITGCEHYSKLLHYVTGAYAPIFEPKTKSFIGVTGVTGSRTIPNPHTLAIVIAVETAIENLLELNQSKEELFVFATSLQIAIQSFEDGVIILDNDMRICEMNPVAKRILGAERKDIYGKYTSDLKHLSWLEKTLKGLFQFQDHEIEEIDCQINNKRYLATIKSLRKNQQDIKGVLVQLKDVRRLTRMLQNIVGDRPRYTIESMAGSSRAMIEIKNIATVTAKSDACVIIEGESGTGKDVIAQAIHNASSRAKNPFVVINCAAIPHELLESTLFGHEKGAFTGASSTHIGKFELADRGTVFLDEIGEMSPAMQAKMLRAIEERKIERVGGGKPLPVDVRVLAATNRDLYHLVSTNQFRADLFYRLNIFRIILPPLRERKEDIFELVQTFLVEFASFYEKPAPRVSEAYLELLLNYDWPGNVRELKNAVQYSIARINDEDELLPSHLTGFFPSRRYPISVTGLDQGRGKLPDIEMKVILKTLESYQGNKTQTARALGISRATVYRKLKTLPLDNR